MGDRRALPVLGLFVALLIVLIVPVNSAFAITEDFKITASDAAADDEFGWSVSIDGDTAIVGVRLDDDVPNSSGSAYIFEKIGGVWTQTAKLTASDAAAGDQFGLSVSIDGDTAIVGANGNDDVPNNSGSAYIFERDEGGADNWGEVTKLTASDAAAGDQFGFFVSIDGDTAIVGASFTGVPNNSGSAYIFERDEGGADSWGEVKKLTASDAAASDFFGLSVSILGDTVIVGAPLDDSSSGSAYIFERDEGGADSWGEVKKLTASDAAAGDAFGVTVSIDGDTAIVAAPGNDDVPNNSGSAYIFERDEGGADNWGEVIKLTASDAAAGDTFGRSVSIDGDKAIVGANGNDDVPNSSGSAYIFERDEGGADSWGEVTKLTASDAAANDQFGRSVSIDGDKAIVGAYLNDDVPDNSGSAYIFEFNGPSAGPPNDSSGGGDNQWDTRPTFGISHETRQDQVVEVGFRFNTEEFTLTDNHWTNFAEQSIDIGTINSFSATVWADKKLKVQEFLFGIPNVGEAHLAELGVEIWYDINGEIEDVVVVQNSHVIDADTVSVSHEMTKCLPTEQELKCDTTTVSMKFLEPLRDKVMAIKAIDWKNRDQKTFLNEGFDISGESLNPMLAKMIPSTVRYEGLVQVTQVAKYSPYWVTDDDRIFEMNSFGSFKQINQSFERFQDTGDAKTRMHSGFGGMLDYEKNRAMQIFDSSNLVSELPASFAYIFPETGERITDEMRQAMLLQEQIAKEVLDEMDKQDRNY